MIKPQLATPESTPPKRKHNRRSCNEICRLLKLAIKPIRPLMKLAKSSVGIISIARYFLTIIAKHENTRAVSNAIVFP